MMRGETIVWDTTRLVRYQKKQKDQARPRYKNVIQKAGLDFDKILNDDSNEVTRLAIWSYLELEKSLDKKKPPHLTVVDNDKKLSDNSVDIDSPGSAETMGIDPDNRGVEVRKDSAVERPGLVARDASETRTLPVFSINTKTVLDRDSDGRDLIRDVPIIETTHTSLRQCDTCFVAANCPAFKPDNMCAFNLPVEVKTKEQLKDLLQAVIEMQGQRVMFMRYAEELNGGYADPNVSQEVDRLFKLVGNMKDLETNKEFVQITASRQTSGGVLSAIFGDRAQAMKEMAQPLNEEQTTQIIRQSVED
jgi:hypothetical protein